MSDEETCMSLIEINTAFGDLENTLDTTSLFEGLETDSSSDEEDVIDGNKERPTHLDKINELKIRLIFLLKQEMIFQRMLMRYVC